MHEIWEALQLEGVEMFYGQFRAYVWRIRKKGATAGASTAAGPAAPGSDARNDLHRNQSLPFVIRSPIFGKAKRKHDWFDYQPELADAKKLIGTEVAQSHGLNVSGAE
jgi:hypothetical protein